MKNLYPVLWLLFSGFAVQAQTDWQLFRPGVQYLYHHPNASYTESPVLGVKIGAEPCTEMYPALRWYGDWECNEVASSFIGYEVCQTDSLTRFRMTDTDYFTIRQHAPVGEKWPAWQWNGETVWGITTEINATSFMGLEDSVKSIYFFTETQNDVQTYLPAPDRPMKLSKLHGLIEALWLRDFPDTSAALPIIGLSEPKVGLQNIGRDDVFNLQVGDELHIIEQNTVGAEIGYYNVKKAIKATITDVQLNASTQTLRYFTTGPMLVTYEGSPAPDPDTIFYPSFNDTWTYPLANYNFLNAQPGSFGDYPGDGATVSLDEFGWGRATKYLASPLGESEPACFRVWVDATGPYHYVEGLAGAYFDVQSLGGPSSRSIHYFKRDSVQLGVPFDFSGITAVGEVPESPAISFGPNPTAGPLRLQLPQGLVADLKLYDTHGRLLLSENQAQGTVEWNLGALPAGAYQISASQEGRLIWRQRVLKL